jgi:DNA integrity scanning protein DisA with diadenylate cyclase activity
MQRQLLEESGENLQELFENGRLVYTVCFKELVRQVSVHCVERGRLVEIVWRGYLGLLEQALVVNIHKQNEIIDTWAARLRETELGHKQAMARMEHVLATANREKLTLERGIKAQDQTISLHELREERLMERIQVVQKHYEHIRMTFLEMREENRILNIQLHNAQSAVLSRQPSITKYKRKTSEDFIMEMKKDPLLQDISKIPDEELKNPDQLVTVIEKYGED